MSAKNETKTLVVHPRTGNSRKMDALVYEAFKKAILQALKGGKELPFTSLAQEVKKIISKTLPLFDGSPSWFTISVKLDLESKGVVESFTQKDRKLNRLVK
jgi:hypothetical protein